MTERKRVVTTSRKRTAKKTTGKFTFTREMIPSFSNGKPEPEFLAKYRQDAWRAFERLDLPKTTEEAWRRTDIRKLETESGGHVPIIGLTAHALKGDKEMCLESGMDDYVPKPISVEKLQDAIERNLGADRRAVTG